MGKNKDGPPKITFDPNRQQAPAKPQGAPHGLPETPGLTPRNSSKGMLVTTGREGNWGENFTPQGQQRIAATRTQNPGLFPTLGQAPKVTPYDPNASARASAQIEDAYPVGNYQGPGPTGSRIRATESSRVIDIRPGSQAWTTAHTTTVGSGSGGGGSGSWSSGASGLNRSYGANTASHPRRQVAR